MVSNPFSAAQEYRIVQHMNDDHRDTLAHYVGGKTAVMAGIDSEGFDVLVSGKKIRFSFNVAVRNMEEARQALIAMAERPA
jgi:putative heme iron utilization protein